MIDLGADIHSFRSYCSDRDELNKAYALKLLQLSQSGPWSEKCAQQFNLFFAIVSHDPTDAAGAACHFLMSQLPGNVSQSFANQVQQAFNNGDYSNFFSDLQKVGVPLNPDS